MPHLPHRNSARILMLANTDTLPHIPSMKNFPTLTAHLHQEDGWFIAFSPEFPEGNGQGRTKEEALESLRQSILLLIEDRREDARAELAEGETLEPLAFA